MSTTPVKFGYIGSETQYTITTSGTYELTVIGATGGADTIGDPGGAGAEVEAYFSLAAGTVLEIYAGDEGGNATADLPYAGGGGGDGSYVYAGADDTLLEVAGGGGGAGYGTQGGAGQTGIDGEAGGSTTGGGGGSNAAGGAGGNASYGSGGYDGGFDGGSGGNGMYAEYGLHARGGGGSDELSGGSPSNTYRDGGGGGGGFNGGGGGASTIPGYSGGGGGGGGSYIDASGTNQALFGGENSGGTGSVDLLLVAATPTWLAGNGLWSNAAHWTGGVPNGPMADAIITVAGAYSVTLAAATSDTVNNVVLNDASANFDLLGTLDLSSTLASFSFDGNDFVLGSAGSLAGGTLDIDSGTLLAKGGKISAADFILGGAASIALSGTALTLAGAAELDGNVVGNGAAGSSLVVTGSADINFADPPGSTDDIYIENNATLVDAGSIAQQDYLELGDSSTDKSGLVIEAGATYNITYNYGIDSYGTGTIYNAGLLEYTGVYSDIPISPAVKNSGILLVTAGDDLLLEGGGSLGGTLAGAGEMDLTSGTFTLSPTLVINVATFGLDGGVIALGGNVAYQDDFIGNGGELYLGGHTLTLQAHTVYGGQPTFLGGTFAGPGVVSVSGKAVVSPEFFYLADGATLVDSGNITEGSSTDYSSGINEFDLGVNVNDTATLSITSTGTFTLVSTPGGVGIYSPSQLGTVTNAGLIDSSADGPYYSNGSQNVILANLDSTGIIRSDIGVLEIEYGNDTIGGTLTGAGEIDISEATFALSSSVVINVATLGLVGGGVVSLGGDLNLSDLNQDNGGTFALDGHNLTLSNVLLGDYAGFTGLGSVRLSGSNSLSIAGDEVVVSGGATLVDAGTIVSDSPQYQNILYLGQGVADSGTLLVEAGASYAIDVPHSYNGISEYVGSSGTVINGGLIESSYTTEGFSPYNFIDATLDNIGTIRSDAGALQLQQGGTIGGTLSGAGEIDFAGGTFTLARTIAITVGTLGFDGGIVTLGSSLNLSASDVTVNYGTVALNGNNLTLASPLIEDSAEFYGPGTVTLTGTGSVNNLYVVGGANLEIAGTLVEDSGGGGIDLTNGAGDSDAVQVDAGGALDLDYSGIDDYGGAATVINFGLVDSKYDYGYDGYSNNLSATLINTGTIESDSGVLDLEAGGTLGGKLTGAGEIDFGGGNFTLLPNISISVATLGILTNAIVTLGSNLSLAGTLNLNSGTIALDGNNLTLAGTGDLAGEIDGPGTVTVTGDFTADGLSTGAGAVLVDAGTITQNDGLNLGDSAGNPGTLVINAGAVYDLQNQGGTESGISESGNATILNAGLFVLTGYSQPNGQNADIAPNITNTGTIADLIPGNMSFDGSLDNDGLITISSGFDVTNDGVSVAGALYADPGDSGTIVLGANAAFSTGGAVAANETFAFTTPGFGSQLDIGDLGAFAGTITGFTALDEIELVNVLANGFTYAHNILTLIEDGALAGTLALGSFSGSLSLTTVFSGSTFIVLNNPGTSYSNPSTATSAKTWNGSSAAWTTAADWSPAGLPGATNTAAINSGTVSFNTTATVYQFNDGYSAKLQMTGGKLTVDDGGNATGTLQVSGGVFDAATSYNFTNQEIVGTAGTLEIDAGALNFSSGNAALAGTLSGLLGYGWVNFAGGDVEFNPGFTFDVAFGYLTGAAVTLGSNVSIAVPFDLYAGALDLAGHNFTLSGTSVLGQDGDFPVNGAGALAITGTAQLAGLQLSGAAHLLDSGLITQEGALYVGNAAKDSSAVSIASTGIYVIDDNGVADNIYETGTGALVNAGKLEVTGYGGDTQNIDPRVVSTGTILVTEGVLALNAGGTLGGTLAGAGALALDGGSFSFASGLVADIGTLALNSTTVAVGGTLSFGGSLIVEGGTIHGGQEGVFLQGAAASLVNTGLIQGNSALIVYGPTHQVSSTGALLENGGYLYNGSGGVITGKQDGVVLAGSLAVPIDVENSGIILGSANTASFIGSAYASFVSTYSSAGLAMVDGGTLTNTKTGQISGFETGLIDAGRVGAGISIYNAGLIEATGKTVASNSTVNACAGVVFEIGGALTNAASGVIAGYGSGFAANTSPGAGVSVDNAGLIEATGATFPYNSSIVGDSVGLVSTVGGTVTNEASGTITGWGDGVIINDIPGGNASLVNRGLIQATGTTLVSNGVTSSALGVVLGGGGTLVNEATGLISGHYGVYLGSGTSNIAGYLGNSGAIYGADLGLILGTDASAGNSGQITAGQIGVVFNTSDTFTNQPGGTVSAGYFGLLAYNGSAANIVNDGLITASSFGILLSNGPGTVANAGTIVSSTADAVALAAGFNNRLVIDPGAVFIGGVNGGDALGASGSSVLELGYGHANFAGLGGQFTNFQTIVLDAHATWAAAGSLAGETIAFGGTQAKLILDQPGAIPATLSDLAPGDTIDIASASVTSAAFTATDLFITLSGAGGVLDEKLTGLATGARSAITSDGKAGSDLTLYRQAAAAAISPSPLAFGNHHVGEIVTAGLTIANIAPSDGYSEGLDATFSGRSGSISTSGALVTLAAGASNSSALSIGLLTGTAGSLAGTAVISLASDGAGFDGNGPLGLGSQTIAVTGAAYAYGAGHLSSSTIALGPVHANAADQAYVTLQNAATNFAYTEGLDAGFTGTSGAATAFGTLSLLGAGVSNSTVLAVGLNDATAGSLTGTATLGLTSDGALTSQLGTTALAAQTITVTGSVYNLATASALPGTISLGQHHLGAPVAVLVTLANSAAPGAYSEKLDASFSGTKLTAGSFSTAGALTTLAAGAQSTALSIKEITTTAGTIGGSAFITLTSDGAGIDTLGKTSLGIDTIAVTGAVFNLATASLGAATLSLGQHHAGVLSTAAINIRNSAAAGAYSEKLDAKFTGTSLSTGSFTTGGTISTLGAGATSFGLGVTLAGAGGLIAGKATLGLTSDGTGIDTLGLTGLTAQTIAVTGTLFNEAAAAISLGTLALGQFHAGALATGDIILANTAPKGIYSEGLDATFSGTTLTHGSFSAAGSVTTLLAGGTDATDLAISLATGTAGTISGVATLALKSDGTGIDALGTTALAAKTEAITGTVFAYAAPKLTSTVVNFGILHAGTAATQALVLSNTNTAAGYTESLDAGFTGASAGVAASGTLTHLAAGLTNSTSLSLGFAAAQNGAVSGTATLALTSDGAGLDTLGTTALAPQVITLTGTIDNYATAALEQLGGAGTLTGSGANYLLNLGNIQQGGGGVTASLGVLNAATGVADLLGGGFTISNTSGAFTDTGFGTFSGLAAGQADSAPVITLSGTNAGAFSELITLSAAGSNASGYKGALGNITLDVTGTVLHTYTLSAAADTLNGAGNDLIIAKSGQLSAGDIINAGTGTNILTLSGGGTFNMGAPATLTGISIVEAQENIGTLAQTLDINSGFGGIVNAASGPAGSSLTVVGNYGGAIINLGNGNDTVYINAPNGTINGGGGNDVFFVSSGDIGATINGGSGLNTLEVAGGTSFAMGANITSISSVVINELATQSEIFTANSIAGLAITGGEGSDTITLGAATQSVVTGTGNTVVDATAAQAGALIMNNGAATLDLTTGGNATLNANDTFLTVSLAAATNLTFSTQNFITAIGSSGADTITAMASQQILTGGAGIDTLIGYAGFGDTFLDTSSGLNGDTIQYFGGSDLIDITNLARAGASLAYAGSTTDGTLSISQAGLGVVDSITFTSGSNLSASLFHMASDGHGGTYLG